MRNETPEEEGKQLQQELNEALGILAPRLGTHPDRVKANAAWVWLGAALFSPAASYVNGDGEVSPVLGAGGMAAAVVCIAVWFLYQRHWWGLVEKARQMIRQRAGR